MNNYNIAFLIFFLLLVSCGSVKDAFTSNKGTKTEEFLVEKKSPLIMPPNFNDLPQPIENSESDLKIENSDIEILISGSDKLESENDVFNNSSSIENFILDEIKKN